MCLSGSVDPQVVLHPKCKPLAFGTKGWVTVTPKDELVMCDDGGIRTSKDDGVSWSPLLPLTVSGDAKPWGPEGQVVLATKSGALVLLYMDKGSYRWKWLKDENRPAPDAKLDVRACRSTDGGVTWTDHRKILDGYCGALIDIKELSTGRIVATLQDLMKEQARHFIFTMVSDDEGVTWKRGNTIDLGGRGDHDGALEPTIVELSDGRVLMLIRTNFDQFWAAYSHDHGLNWRELGPSGIRASSAPGHVIRLKNGRLALVYNPLCPKGTEKIERLNSLTMTESHPSWYRAELWISFSDDDGRSWSEPVVLARHTSGRLSYPYILERRPGEIWCAVRYTEGKPVCFAFLEKDFTAKAE